MNDNDDGFACQKIAGTFSWQMTVIVLCLMWVLRGDL